jgi:hypothetical protein
MQSRSEPPLSDNAPSETTLTDYDRQHLVTYLRLLDAEKDDADWREIARVVLQIDPDREPERARNAWQSHLSRAHWMSEHGYQFLLQGAGRH